MKRICALLLCGALLIPQVSAAAAGSWPAWAEEGLNWGREAAISTSATSRRDRRCICPTTWAVADRSDPPAAGGAVSTNSRRSGTATAACFTAPLVFKNSRDRSTMVFPRQRSTMRGEAVTTAT